ncbi:cation efflux family-domain-containing protein [Radiomyces spectabilis]|uniref:cation efflux family-domain-containing protein n=1 Tax=Radiomyces spectabilis TaxID=64574 RepID=UPI00221E3DD1|nr:cation efflux family-domain-containing protein [Radiomyces spectabilis]KAI8384811.1 cation efflux family-domain-containing protein [Radiomyces spectabilis]
MLRLSRQARIVLMLCINGGFFIAEIVIGYYVKSLALVADSFHMLNDMLAFSVALWAINVASHTRRDPKYSYGWQRAEILGALVNGVFLIALCFTIVIDAIERFISPEPVTDPKLVLITGGAGLAGNLLGLVLFHEHGHHHGHHNHSGHEKNIEQGHLHHDTHHSSTGGHLNMKGIFLHVLGDALGNIGVMASALIIWLGTFSWRFYFDPIVSLVIAIIIFASALPLVRETSIILLQGVPGHVPLDDVRSELLKMEDVISIHELHIWQLSDTKMIASLHVLLKRHADYMRLATQMRQLLHNYGVHSATIQPEFTKLDGTSKTDLLESSEANPANEPVPLPPQHMAGPSCVSTATLATATPSLRSQKSETIDEETCLLRCMDDSCKENTCCPDSYVNGPDRTS